MTRTLRPTLASAFVLSLLLSAACGGGGQSTRTDTRTTGNAVSPLATSLGPIPAQGIDPEALFGIADNAFQSNDLVKAEDLFSRLYIVAPNHRGGVAFQALQAISQRTGRPLDHMLARARFIQDAYYGKFNPIEMWPPQQATDFGAIVDCWDRLLSSDFPGALGVGQPLTRAPLPGFAESAGACTTAASTGVVQIQRKAASDAAWVQWQNNEGCLMQHYARLMEAHGRNDWERFVRVYPDFLTCSSVLQGIIEAGTLAGDPRVAGSYDRAWATISEVSGLIQANRRTWDRIGNAVTTLDSNPDYNGLWPQWKALAGDEATVNEQIESLRRAQAPLTGPPRDQLGYRIEALEAQLSVIRRQKDDVLKRANRFRKDVGLPALATLDP